MDFILKTGRIFTKSKVKTKKKFLSQKVRECPRILVFISKIAQMSTKSNVKAKKKGLYPKIYQIFLNSGVKPQKQTVFIAKSTKKQFLPTNSGVITSILEVSGFELLSEAVNLFWEQSLLAGSSVARWGLEPSPLACEVCKIAQFLVLLRPIFCEKLKIAPPIGKQPPSKV